MGLIGFLFKLTIWATVSILLVLFLLVFLPSIELDPQSYNLPKPPDFVGPLADNNILSQGERLFENDLKGPESVIQHKGSIYTGLSDGRIVRIKGNKYETVAHIGNECRAEGIWEQRKCGRPLGLRFDKKDNLFAIDAYHGIKKINIKTGKVVTVFDISTPINGRKSLFFDDIVIDEGAGKNGGNVFYVSDASSRWDSDFHVGITAEHESTGRIIRYDDDAKLASTVVDGIGFPNGVELTDDRTAVIYSELNSRRLMIHYIKGPKVGKTEILVSNLPGEPDNVRRSLNKQETYWVALFSARNGTHPHFFLDDLQTKPLIRKAIARGVYNAGVGIYWLGETFGFVPFKELGYGLKSGFLFAKNIIERGLVLEVSREGKYVSALHSPDKHITGLSEAREVLENGQRVLYLGSYYNYYLGRLVLPKQNDW